MMGSRRGAQGALFYDFSLEDHVPADHLLRSIDRFVDLTDVRRHLAPFYSAIGRPSVDPELMIRMLLIGYFMGIRSERRLCDEIHLNLAYRWFCRLDLTDQVPDHSTFSKNRHGRFRESNLFRCLFEGVVGRCITENLVGGESFAVDASLIRADANKQNATPIGDWPAEKLDPRHAPRAVREYLDTLDDAAFGAATEKTPKLASGPPAQNSTGGNKMVFGEAVLEAVENDLADAVRHAGPVTAFPPLPVDRYVAMSALQKAVRRGREELALSAAANLLSGSAPGFWRRMIIIASASPTSTSSAWSPLQEPRRGCEPHSAATGLLPSIWFGACAAQPRTLNR